MRGSTNEERLFLYDLPWLEVKKTDMPNIDQTVARHRARYHLGAFLARPGMKVLDFPCGSGYGSDIVGEYGLVKVDYEGFDLDPVTIQYADHYYGGKFDIDDLRDPQNIGTDYDLIMCIEGLEHIEIKHHDQLMKRFGKSHKPDGRWLVSMPEAPVESGPSKTNKYHLGELIMSDFYDLITKHFKSVQFITLEDKLHNGIKSKLMYAIAGGAI